ncbi:MAG: TadE/TadG family type IV pilus assembly protein [Dehalococcoidia bacterium]
MPGRLAEWSRSSIRRWWVAQDGQALVETALVLPLLLLLAFGVVGVTRVTQARMEVSAVAREAARAAALADSPAEATSYGLARGHEVATDYDLTNGSLQLALDPGGLDRGAPVRATARYEVELGDLPLLGGARVSITREHAERTDLYRSRWSAGGEP